jgi:RimJ/RimL family protein N-acetyltransferase
MPVGRKVVLREKQIGDGDDDYAWRCDPDLALLDGTSPLKMPPEEYMSCHADELKHPDRRRRRFAVDSLDGKHIGNIMYYDIDEDRRQAELGIVIGDRDYWGKGYGADAVTCLVYHIFKETSLDRIYLNTLEWNIRAQRCFEKCGFIACGRATRRGNDFLIMELHRSWLKSPETETELASQGADCSASHPPST